MADWDIANDFKTIQEVPSNFWIRVKLKSTAVLAVRYGVNDCRTSTFELFVSQDICLNTKCNPDINMNKKKEDKQIAD